MNERPYRSFFWPIVLIGVGLVWLLGNLGIIPAVNFGILATLWPLILIVIGLDILFARRSPLAGALIGLFAIAVVVFVLITGPALGLPTAGVMQTRSIDEPIGAATSAEIRLDTTSVPVNIYALVGGESLMQAEIDYYGSLRFNSSGNPVRRIRLDRVGQVNFGLIPFDMMNARWDIGLSPNIPIDLRIDAASGSSEIDLSDLHLTGLEIDQGSGSVSLNLPPAAAEDYTARIQGGSGSLGIDLPAEGGLTLRLDGGSGSIRLNAPAGAGIRLEIRNAGSGSVNVGADLERVSGQGKAGVWETPGLDNATRRIVIICDDLGSGSFNLR